MRDGAKHRDAQDRATCHHATIGEVCRHVGRILVLNEEGGMVLKGDRGGESRHVGGGGHVRHITNVGKRAHICEETHEKDMVAQCVVECKGAWPLSHTGRHQGHRRRRRRQRRHGHGGGGSVGARVGGGVCVIGVVVVHGGDRVGIV